MTGEKITFHDFKDDIKEALDFEPIGRLKYFLSSVLVVWAVNVMPELMIFGLPYYLLLVAKRTKDIGWSVSLITGLVLILNIGYIVLALNGIYFGSLVQAKDLSSWLAFVRMMTAILQLPVFIVNLFLVFKKGKK